ncbi:MAG: DUF177 domain-containing protein [Bacteroidia bacterium]
MAKLGDFEIDLNFSINESFQCSYKITDSFFSIKENSLYTKADINVDLNCTRREANLELLFEIKGFVLVECERCLKPIRMDVTSSFLDVKTFTSDTDLLKLENYVSEDQNKLSVYDSIYEQICIAMPQRLICDNAMGSNKCDFNLETEQEPTIDPRWNELKKLID